MNKPIRVVILGAGDRGMHCFGKFALDNTHLMKVVGVAEPNNEKRELFAKQHSLYGNQVFNSWEKLLGKPQMSDALINATLDDMHYESTIQALDKGYQVLLEKPISNTPEKVISIAKEAERSNQLLQICYELRYTPFFSSLKEIIDSGEIGDIVTIESKESLVYWHMAHSFVRGNWRDANETAPMLLAKTCHDYDILTWLIQSECKFVSSFGSLNYFRKENAPPGAPDRCIDGCKYESECPYSAMKIYLNNSSGWPVSVISVDNSLEARIEALKNGPYGRCIFKCDNDVVDNQIVNLEFENRVHVSFTMTGHSHENTRTIRISGTKGTLRGHFKKGEIEIANYNTGQIKKLKTTIPDDTHGHGGGDQRLLKDFLTAVNSGEIQHIRSGIKESIESHLIIFAAEKARSEKQVIDFDDFKNNLRSI